MTALTPAAALATRIAAHEAVTAESPMVEKEHLFIGILSLDKVLKEDGPGTAAQAGVAKEHAAVTCLLEITGLDATVLRRLMRQAPGCSGTAPAKPAIHRSPACKKYFERAAVLAGGKPASCLHLFSAIMERPGLVIGDVLAESRRCRAALRETDVLLPKATGGPELSRSYAGTFDLREELNRSIAGTRDLLALLPVESQEYAIVKRALARQHVSLALLCLDAGDDAGLAAAVQSPEGTAGRDTSALAAACQDLAAARGTHGGGVREAADRVRCLLLKWEEEAGRPAA